jgi:hypothetical protein
MTALDFLAGRACTPIGATATATTQGFREDGGANSLITPAQPKGTVERDLPGAY